MFEVKKVNTNIDLSTLVVCAALWRGRQNVVGTSNGPSKVCALPMGIAGRS